MKMESQRRQDHILFLATENVILHVNQPYKIRQDMIEGKNFIPEAFLMHQFHDSMEFGIHSVAEKAGGESMRGLFPGATPYEPYWAIGAKREETRYLSDEDDEDEDWDDEDEEWDDEDEEWDDEDEEWDDEDEEWDDEDEDFDEDEDWSDDEEE